MALRWGVLYNYAIICTWVADRDLYIEINIHQMEHDAFEWVYVSFSGYSASNPTLFASTLAILGP